MNHRTISKNHVNEHVVRLVAAQVLILTLAVVLTSWEWLAFLLAVDFALRAFTRIPSPLALIARSLANTFKLAPKPIFAAPKRFAAGLGLLFSLLIGIFLSINWPITALVTAIILAFCALLEAAFNICIGCYIYNWVIVPIFNRNIKTR